MGAVVSGTTQDYGNAEALRGAGFDVRATRFHSAEKLNSATDQAEFLQSRLRRATHVLSTIGPTDNEDPVLACVDRSLTNAQNLAWVGYLSSTSVYGEHRGGWVDEQTAPKEPGSMGKARLTAEKMWQQLAGRHPRDVQLHILRLAGIYGPGRSAIDSLLKNPHKNPPYNDGKDDIPTSRIHVDDLLSAVVNAAGCVCDSGVYNIADDQPASQLEVRAYARSLILNGSAGKTVRDRFRRSLAQAPDSSCLHMSRRRKERTNKLVSNRKMRERLLCSLKFPTYREGLHNIAQYLRARDEIRYTT